MPAQCLPWTEPVEAADAFQAGSDKPKYLVIFGGGIASSAQDDNADILTSPVIQQRVLDLLDEPAEG